MINHRVHSYRLMELVLMMSSGDIRIPEFQRRFAWRSKQMIELFQSIYKGYPIGQFVFAEVFESKSQRRVYEAIDGAQRLRAIYECLTLDDSENKAMRIVFDIDSESFRTEPSRAQRANYISLSSLFSPNMLTGIHAASAGVEGAEKFIGVAVELHRRIAQYEVPVLVIDGNNHDEVLSVFMALNTTGTKLTRKEIERATALRRELPDS